MKCSGSTPTEVAAGYQPRLALRPCRVGAASPHLLHVRRHERLGQGVALPTPAAALRADAVFRHVAGRAVGAVVAGDEDALRHGIRRGHAKDSVVAPRVMGLATAGVALPSR